MQNSMVEWFPSIPGGKGRYWDLRSDIRWHRVDLLRSWSTPERCASASFFLYRKTCGLMLATGGEIELGFIICSGTEQVSDFLFGCRPDCGMLVPLYFSTVRAAIRQRDAFKAVTTGIAEIVIQMCSPQSSSGYSSITTMPHFWKVLWEKSI